MIGRTYSVLQHLSIDIVFGAVILLHFFSKLYEVSIGWSAYVLLGSSIWLIYTIDHLRDAKTAVSGKRERYVFHATNERWLKLIAVIVLILAGTCLLFVQKSIMIGGSILVAFSTLYVVFQSSFAKLGLKELYISIVYTLGILVAPIALSRSFDSYSFFLLWILTYLNLIIFSWFERDDDVSDSFASIATKWGSDKLIKLILVISSLGFALGLLSISEKGIYSIYLIIILIIFILLVFNPAWAKQKSRYRTIGDAVFLLPILFELL